MLKTIGKTFSLLWQVFLHVGPSYEKLELFTRSVVSMTVDFGVESLIPGMPDMLGAFCVYCKIPVPKVGVHRRASTFPRCVVSPGWHHIWDGLTKRGLESTYWFPLFLKQTKLVQSFLRNNMTEMVDELERHGKTSVSALLQSVRLENFAKWRWNTLRRVVSELRKVFATLRRWFDWFGFVKTLKDATELLQLRETFASVDYIDRLEFVDWHTSWIGHLDRWGGGCACHGLDGTGIQCSRQGRRLDEAWPYFLQSASKALEEAEGMFGRCVVDVGNTP